MKDTRYKITPPERTGPIRNPIMPRGTAGDAPVNGSRASCSTTEDTCGGVQDALECGVRTAYTVIEQYMQRGFDAARNIQDQIYGRGQMRDNKPNFTGWSNPCGPMASPIEQWVTAVRAWTDMWSALVLGGTPCGTPQSWMGGMGFAGATPPLVVRVAAHGRQAEVTANLTPAAACGQLTVDVPGLDGLSIFRENGKVCVGLQVGPEERNGKYVGIIKADGREVGTLSVTITEQYGKPA